MFLHAVVSKDVDADSVLCGNRKFVGIDVGVNPTAITSEKRFVEELLKGLMHIGECKLAAEIKEEKKWS